MIQKTHVIQSSTTDIGSSTLALAPECTTDQAKTWLCRAAFRCCVRGESWKDQGSCNVSRTVSVFPKICIQWLQVCSEKRLVQSACSTLSTHGLLEGSTESTTDIEGSGESKIEINGCHSRKEGESKTGIAFALGGVLGAAHENDMPKSHFIETECTAQCRLETKRKKSGLKTWRLHAETKNRLSLSSLNPHLNELHVFLCKSATSWHSVALWTRTLSQVWTCVKYVPRQSIP